MGYDLNTFYVLFDEQPTCTMRCERRKRERKEKDKKRFDCTLVEHIATIQKSPEEFFCVS